MPAIQIPGTNITYGWQEREKGWGPGMNTNLLVMGQVARGSVISRQQSAPPADPEEGDAYLVPAGATGEWLDKQDKIAAFHSDAWLYIEPFGSPVLVEGEGVHVYWNGAAYQQLEGTGDVEEAPEDGKQYARQDGDWVEVDASAELPTGAFQLRDAAWSWWVKPVITRIKTSSHDLTFFSYTNNAGAICAGQYDHVTGRLKSRILNKNFSPDDHNAGSVVAQDGRLVYVFPARKATVGGAGQLFVYHSDSYDIDGLSGGAVPAIGVTNYPNSYVSGGDLFIFYRSDQATDQWRMAKTTLANPEVGHSTSLFFSDVTTWPYLAIRRSTSNPSRLNIALGWHPINESYSSIHAGYIDLATGDVHDWDGTYRANINSGDGLPLDKSDFQIVYTPGAGVKTRLYDIHEESIAFSDFDSSDDAGGDYKVARWDGSSWGVQTVAPTGQPFTGLGVRNYFGGAAISESDQGIIYLSREQDDAFIVERYKYSGSGWDLDAVIDRKERDDNGALVRPMAVTTSVSSTEMASGADMLFLSGQFSPLDFTKFACSVLTPSTEGLPISVAGPEPLYPGVGDPAVMVVRDTNPTISDSSTTSLQWEAELYDDGGMFDAGASSTDIVIPVDGRYNISGGYAWISDPNGRRVGRIEVEYAAGGTEALARCDSNAVSSGATSLSLAATGIPLSSGDKVRMTAYQDSGGPLQMSVTTMRPFLSVSRAK